MNNTRIVAKSCLLLLFFCLLGGTAFATAPYTYQYDYGDGSPVEIGASEITHTYQSPGQYTITYTVTGSDGGVQTTTRLVTVNPPTLAATINIDPESGNAPLTVSMNAVIEQSSTPPYSFSWDFGDGSSAGEQQNMNHTYTTPDTYTVKLTVSDAAGQSVSKNQTIIVSERPNEQPSVSIISLGATGGPAPFTVELQASGSDSDGYFVDGWWDFGDGTSTLSALENLAPTHTYSLQGNYTVSLTGVDDRGASATATLPIVVTYADKPPTCTITSTVTEGKIPLTAGFVAQGTDPEGGQLTFSWDFGDGTSGEGSTASHTFSQANTYTVTLTAKDTAGLTGTAQQQITAYGDSAAPLSVSPTGVPETGIAPLNTLFTPGIVGGTPPYSYSWDFGDNSQNKTDEIPSHTFAQAGIYSVALTVTDQTGNSASGHAVISVSEPDVSGFSVNPTSMTISEGNESGFTIFGGSGFNSATSMDGDIASVIQKDGTRVVVVTGEKQGSTVITVQDSEGNSLDVPVTVSQKVKAIIVAGGGPYRGNTLWPATKQSANSAYRTLAHNGFTEETIFYLTSETEYSLENDINGNGQFDERDGPASKANLQTAITQWAGDAKDLYIYLVDHGGDAVYQMSETEMLDAEELDVWLDTLQETLPGRLVVVYDACQSGSFIEWLRPPEGKERVVITSADSDEDAVFITYGLVSFSSYFWTGISNGMNIYDAFVHAKDALSVDHQQTPQVNGNGNSQGNEIDDGDLASVLYIGKPKIVGAAVPNIGSGPDPITLQGETSALLYADNVISANGVDRVWAVIMPPDFDSGSPDTPIINMLSIDLYESSTQSNRYEGVFNGFEVTGEYQIAYYAKDESGSISFPVSATVTQEAGSSTVSRPPAPTLVYDISGSTVAISWSIVNADSYTLHYAPAPYDNDPSTISKIDMGTQTELTTTLWPGASYLVAITGLNSAGESSYSNIIQIEIK